MCGICGYTGTLQNNLLEHMGDAILHRGPDETGYIHTADIHLASKRLSIVDLPGGSQPITSPDGRFSLVWNGEIYNHQELRAALVQNGHVFQSDHSDSEVLLHVLLERGTDGLSQLNGMFAIALWDHKLHTLTLIRDRLGIKPLYYAKKDEVLYFASEVKSLLQVPTLSKERNLSALYEYFSFQNALAPETPFSEISELLPGEVLVFSASSIHKERWYETDFSTILPASTQEAVDNIHQLLLNSVKLRLKSDDSCGFFLSGGLDSSLLLCMATTLTGHAYPAYTLSYDVKQAHFHQKQEDTLYAKKAAARFHCPLTEIFITPEDVIQALPQMIASFDQPFSGSMSTYFLAKEARKHHKVILSGDGADEVFGGYPLHTSDLSMKYLVNLKDEDKTLFLNEDRFSSFFRSHATAKNVSNILAHSTATDSVNKALEYSLRVNLPNHVLRYTDTLSMAHSLEVRSPFLDCRLVHYLSTLPGDLKIQENTTKYLLKQVASSYLPEAFIHRKKEWLNLPIYDWLPVELKDFVLSTLSPGALLKYDFLNAENVLFLLQAFYKAPEKLNHLSPLLWNLVCFQIWCEQLS